MSRSKFLALLSAVLPIGSIIAFSAFWSSGLAMEWFTKGNHKWGFVVLFALAAAVALSVVAAIVLGLLAWRAARREGRSGWALPLIGVVSGGAAALFLVVVASLTISTMALFL